MQYTIAMIIINRFVYIEVEINSDRCIVDLRRLEIHESLKNFARPIFTRKIVFHLIRINEQSLVLYTLDILLFNNNFIYSSIPFIEINKYRKYLYNTNLKNWYPHIIIKWHNTCGRGCNLINNIFFSIKT